MDASTSSLADAADLRKLHAAAEGLDPGLVRMVLAGEGVTGLDPESVPKAKVAVLLASLRACTPWWPPMPLVSELDRQR